MPQSLSRVYIHLVFSTKQRHRAINENVKADLHAYTGGILKSIDCSPLEINTEPDHAHLLFTLSRTKTMAQVVREVKKGSTLWLKNQDTEYRDFHWQLGYGAFSVSESGIPAVKRYILNQSIHHQKFSFQDEFRKLCVAYKIKWDERYVWD